MTKFMKKVEYFNNLREVDYLIRTDENYSKLELKKPAKKICRIEYMGYKINPIDYNVLGEPLFSKVQADFFSEELEKNIANRGCYKVTRKDGYERFYKFRIIYKPMLFYFIPKFFYNSKFIISKSLGNLECFRGLIEERLIAAKTGKKLDSFLIANKILLSNDGKAYYVHLEEMELNEEEIIMVKDIENWNPDYIEKLYLPHNEYCLRCGKKISIEDIIYSQVDILNNVHIDCNCISPKKK